MIQQNVCDTFSLVVFSWMVIISFLMLTSLLWYTFASVNYMQHNQSETFLVASIMSTNGGPTYQ